MFDLGAGEILLIVIVAIVVIGPKDMPLALRTAGRWLGRVRRLSTHFRTGLDAMIREAEMEEMEKKWREQNEKVMREHPDHPSPEMEPTGAYPASSPPALPDTSAEARETPPPVDEPKAAAPSADAKPGS